MRLSRSLLMVLMMWSSQVTRSATDSCGAKTGMDCYKCYSDQCQKEQGDCETKVDRCAPERATRDKCTKISTDALKACEKITLQKKKSDCINKTKIQNQSRCLREETALKTCADRINNYCAQQEVACRGQANRRCNQTSDL